MLRQLKPALVLFALLTLLAGILYPLGITGISSLFFPDRSTGSLIEENGQPVGSALIGQNFTSPEYFWGRPSATPGTPYSAGNSSGSNYGPLSQAWVDAVRQRVETLRTADPGNMLPIPVDLVTASASGLDPHISAAAAYYQVARVARARGLSEADVRALVDEYTESPLLGFLGEARVNVLLLNLALDGIQ